MCALFIGRGNLATALRLDLIPGRRTRGRFDYPPVCVDNARLYPRLMTAPLLLPYAWLYVCVDHDMHIG